MTPLSFRPRYFMIPSKTPTQPWMKLRNILEKQSGSKSKEYHTLIICYSPNFRHIISVVDEVTDDKTLPRAERKRLQIVNAPNKSSRAKLVKLADKLYNLRDLDRVVPE